MNFSFRIIVRFLSDKRVIALVAICVCVAAAALYFASRSTSRFVEEYVAYANVAKAQDTAAYVPAAQNNPVRQDLNAMLSLSLDASTPPSKRIAYAQQGLGLLKQLDGEVDDIGTMGEKADAAIAEMQVQALKDFSTSGQTFEIISLAKQRSSIIEDIRGLSYRADFETGKIFKRIIDDKGALTAEHVVALNDEIPNVEAQFDHRTSLYDELTKVSNQIDQKAAALGATGVFATTTSP